MNAVSGLTEQNIENRKKGIGASEAAIVLGLNSYVSPYQLWLVKTGKAKSEDLSDVPIVHWGNVLEEPIAEEYERVSGNKIRRLTSTLFHKKYPHMLCHLDRKIEGERKHLECKFAMMARDEWGESGSDFVPLKYIVQVQHQLAVTGYDEADLAVLIGGYDFRIYPFKRDEALIARIEKDVTAFWQCVETDTPPALRDSVDAALMYPFNQGDMLVADDDIELTIADYCSIRQQEKELKESKVLLKDTLTLFIKDNDGIRNGSHVLATWKANAKGKRTLLVKEPKL